MKFGPVPVADALGAVLAHSLAAGDLRMRKGRRLGEADIRALAAAGIAEITAAILEAGDVGEDVAAARLARLLAPVSGVAGLTIAAAFAGRVNVHAAGSGLIRVDRDAIDRLNGVSPAMTVATLPDMARVAPRALVATVKIIPYAVSGGLVDKACRASGPALKLMPFTGRTATLLLTRTPGMKERLVQKGRAAVALRAQSLGLDMSEVTVVPHRSEELAGAIRTAKGEIILALTGSATSDENDVGPAALVAAGGRLIRFGMPVDPGNLLFLGEIDGRPVVGLPGCARSPALNGADWVLERLAAGIAVTGEDISAMGVGGLLKEIPTRPQPRDRTAALPSPSRPNVEVLLLAAGASRRMRGRDKLLEDIDGEPLLRRTARAMLGAQADRVHVVLPPGNPARRAALSGLEVNIVEAADWRAGLSASIRAGVAGLSGDCDAVVIALADMPEVTPAHIDRLIAAFDPAEGREICRAVAAGGTAGHPVLFGRRFFEPLANLRGDRGARDVLADAAEFVVDVATDGPGAVVDLDTPEAWADWRKRRAAAAPGTAEN